MARKREKRNFISAVSKAVKTIEKMKEQKPKKLMEELDEMAKSEIARWYASYEPRKYRRQRSLYQAYRIYRDPDSIDVEMMFDSDFIYEYFHDQDNEIVYANSFISGYHGGSWGTDRNNETVDTPHWRKPFLHYTSWADEAPQTFSPYETILQKSQEMMDDYDKEWANDLESKVLKPLERSLRGLKRK